MTRWAPAALCLAALGAHASPGADEHLRQGARHFREARYAEALVEFRVAERLGAGGDAAWYAAATLVKLGRHEDALEAFAQAEAAAPSSRDALLDYYRALACWGAKLYLCADALLRSVGESSGPRIAEQAARMRGQIAALLTAEPRAEAIDWYHRRGQRTLAARRPALAAAYYAEAVALAQRRSDRHRLDEARARLLEAQRMAVAEGDAP